MSSGGDGGDVNNVNEFDSSIEIEEQIIDAIKTYNFVRLRAILAQKNNERITQPAAVTDADIRKALYHAASVDGGVTSRVECCRLLWEALSQCSKKKYFATKSTFSFQSPLHVAVQRGHLEIVRFFIQELKWNINQIDHNGDTPLCYTCGAFYDNQRHSLEMARFLLQNGANFNIKGKHGGPLQYAVSANNTEIVRLLLMEYHVNPNRNQESYVGILTFHAIGHGNAEIMRMLLECGAFLGRLKKCYLNSRSTQLNDVLSDIRKSREDKVAICRILITHAHKNPTTAASILESLEFVIKNVFRIDECRILLDAGFDSRTVMYCTIKSANCLSRHLFYCQFLVNEYQADPFLQDGNEEEDDETAASPFHAAARLWDTSLFEYFLGIWNERFASTGGKNGDGDYPIHVVCCDPHVSIQAIHLLVNHHPDALAVVDGEQGLLPFHFAANWGASQDVIFYLLQHCPDALFHCRNAVVGVPHRHPSQPTVDGTNMSASTTTTTTATTTTTSETLDSNNDDSRRKKKARTTRYI